MKKNIEVSILECQKEQGEINERRFAIKLVEKVVWALVGAILLIVVGALIRLVIVN